MCDDIRRADDAVQIRVFPDQVRHRGIPAPGIEVRDAPGHTVRVEPRLAERVLPALPSGQARRLVIFRYADKGDAPSAFLKHEAGQFAHAAPVVVVDAGKPVEILTGDHQRDRAVLQRDLLDLAEGGRHEYDPRDAVVLHHVEILQFSVFFLVRIAQQGQIVALKQFLRDSVHHLIDGLREDSGDNDPHLSHLTCSHGLGHQVGAVPGLLDRLGDPILFILAQRPSVEVPADSRGRDSRKPGYFLNRHMWSSSRSRSHTILTAPMIISPACW